MWLWISLIITVNQTIIGEVTCHRNDYRSCCYSALLKIGLICGSTVFLSALGLMVIVLAILIARAGIARRQLRRHGKRNKTGEAK